MNRSTALTIASMPAVAGIAWHKHRQTERAATLENPSRPFLPGSRHEKTTHWGSVSYRLIEGSGSGVPLVLVHGWGKSGDSAWWPILEGCRSSMVIIDLPGHGHSRLDTSFSLELAAEALLDALDHSGLHRPILVAHSMGGPVAMTAMREVGSAPFAGFVAMATSAYWVAPRVSAMMALAPYVMDPRSPIVSRTKIRDVSRNPGRGPQICWSYSRRPSPAMLRQGAAALRRFDASGWNDLEMPNAHWVIPTEDRVLPPHHQHASARLVDAEVHEVRAGHSVVMDAPSEINAILDEISFGL